MLNTNKNISELDLYRNNIGDASSENLSKLKYVKKLNLSLNSLSDEGIKPLVLNANFSHIDLSRNDLSDNAAEFIEKNATQAWINISEKFRISETMLRAVNEKINKSVRIEDSFIIDENDENIEELRVAKRRKLTHDEVSHTSIFLSSKSEKLQANISKKVSIFDEEIYQEISNILKKHGFEVNNEPELKSGRTSSAPPY